MSDVLAFTKERTLLLTGLTNPQVVRTAELVDLCGLVFVRGKRPPEEVVELAREKGLPILLTENPLYETCGILYAAGLPGCRRQG
ncbi:MAG: DRTGG domain-containing protein, partial [Bacteroidota bacterium]